MLVQEIRFALRLLTRNPAFTAIAALSLALGIGANSAVFSLADALLLKPLPVEDAARVVTVGLGAPNRGFSVGAMSYPDYRDFSEKSKSFDGLTAWQLKRLSAAKSASDVPQMRAALMVSDNFFQVLGIKPVLGRGYAGDEAKVSGRDGLAVLSYDYWRSEFAGDSSVVGRTMRINGLDFTLVSYSVARRTREIGVRMAIGASRSDVLGMVLKQGMTLALSGIAVGAVLSVLVGKALSAGLIGFGAVGAATYVMVPVVLLMVTLISCYVPARRAAKVDPMVALRYE